MLIQLLTGSIIISFTVFVEVAFIYAVIYLLKKTHRLHFIKSDLARSGIILTGVTLWLLAAFSIATWIWAISFYLLECFSDLEESLYFAMVAFTSLGLGDVILPTQWRLLSGMIAANGLLLFGLNTAVLIETMSGLMNNRSSIPK